MHSCSSTTAAQEWIARRSPLPIDRPAAEVSLLLWFLLPTRPFLFRRWVKRSGHTNMVLPTPYYICSYYCLRLIGSDSGPTRRMSNVNGLICQWFATIGGLGRQRLRVLVLRPVGWGGELPDPGSTIGDEKQRPVPRLSHHASGAPRR